MILPSNRVRIMVATKPIDLRKGHDGLAALVKNELHKDPFAGGRSLYSGHVRQTGYETCRTEEKRMRAEQA